MNCKLPDLHEIFVFVNVKQLQKIWLTFQKFHWLQEVG